MGLREDAVDTIKIDDSKRDIDTNSKDSNSRTDLSQQAMHPKDSDALRDVKADARTSANPDLLPPMETTKAPTLDRDTLDKTVDELHKAINLKSTFFGKNPNKDKVFRLLETMTQADRRVLEQLYEGRFGDINKANKLAKANADKSGIDFSSDFNSTTLRRDIQLKLGPDSVEHARLISIMNRQDGKTNDAGALMVAIKQTKDDSGRGNVAIRTVFESLNEKQIQELELNFKRDYGKTWQRAVLDLGSDITEQTWKSLEILDKGVDKRSTADVKELANLAVSSKDARLFGEVMRGDAPSTVQARKELLADRKFLKALTIAFPQGTQSSMAIERLYDRANSNGELQVGRNRINLNDLLDPVAKDYLTEGRISLKTIATQNTGKWLLDAKDNINLAAKNASETERKQFILGSEITSGKRTPQTQVEKEAKAYYDALHKTFSETLDEREVSVAEALLKYGRESVLTEMAGTHSEAWRLFGLVPGHERQDLMLRAENIREADYNLLRDPVRGKQFRSEIESSLRTYVDDSERVRIMMMLDEKAAKPTYDDSKSVARSLTETIEDNKGVDFVIVGRVYHAENILNKFFSMPEADAAKLKTNPDFAKQMREFVKGKSEFRASEQLLASRMIDKAVDSGKAPKADETDKLLKLITEGVQPSKVVIQSHKAFEADSQLSKRLSQPYETLSESDKTLVDLIRENFVKAQALCTISDVDKFVATGNLSLQDRINLGFDRKSVIESAAAASPAERAATRKHFSLQERAIIDSAAASGGKLSLADRIQMVTSDINGVEPKMTEFKSELEAMRKAPDGMKTLMDAKAEFARKYGRNLDEAVLSKADDRERSEFKRLLTPTESDGRQTFYDNMWKALRSDSGLSADGTSLTMRKSLDQSASSLEEYQRIYQTLPADKQKALDEYFNQSWEQHKQSKEKLADLVTTATITAAALATAPFTAGMSMAALASWVGFAATTSAAFTVAAKITIMGKDYDESHMMRDIVHGAAASGLMFGIPPAANIPSLFGQGAKTILAEGVFVTALGVSVHAAERVAMEKGLAQSLMNVGKNFTEKDALAVIQQSSPSLSEFASKRMAADMVESVSLNYGSTIEAGLAKLHQQGAESGRDAARRFIRQMNANLEFQE